jgi:hypothetical protein
MRKTQSVKSAWSFPSVSITMAIFGTLGLGLFVLACKSNGDDKIPGTMPLEEFIELIESPAMDFATDEGVIAFFESATREQLPADVVVRTLSENFIDEPITTDDIIKIPIADFDPSVIRVVLQYVMGPVPKEKRATVWRTFIVAYFRQRYGDQ